MSKLLYHILDSIIDLDILLEDGKFEYSFFGEPSFNMRYLYIINGEIHFVFYEYDLTNNVDPNITIAIHRDKKTARIIEFQSKKINWLSESNEERFIRYIKEKITVVKGKNAI